MRPARLLPLARERSDPDVPGLSIATGPNGMHSPGDAFNHKVRRDVSRDAHQPHADVLYETACGYERGVEFGER